MEQHSAHASRDRRRHRADRPASPGAPGRPRPSGARLTGLGCGLLAVGTMTAAGGLDALLLSGDPAAYGICFVLVSAVCALWVRPAELLAAPIAAPIAFTAGALFLGDEADGAAGLLVELVTVLAVNAGWVYGGTLTAAAVVLVRRGTARRRAVPAAREGATDRADRKGAGRTAARSGSAG
ncbi:DUF6542 domain-containing protein [Streptomyces sp. TRM 70361]|uniref:DUF6542 domain-containing protein n=1 Tax=Streptomyces sp. TRM 70361 TaxID=3116553 RepID=UPI002E7B3341|nr:DUF6542 domain-containing protein [Streptomyces sp. TRM 70361]MEE1939251.1 DUF6542 domain-containing protein [Streptomyces sp. TRM 70361]